MSNICQAINFVLKGSEASQISGHKICLISEMISLMRSKTSSRYAIETTTKKDTIQGILLKSSYRGHEAIDTTAKTNSIQGICKGGDLVLFDDTITFRSPVR